MAANFGRKLTQRDLPLIAQLAQGLGTMHDDGMEESPLQQGSQGSLAAIRAANRAQPTGSLADSGRPTSSVLLGTGMSTGGPGGHAPLQFKRYATTRPDGQIMEAHDYGNGNVKYFRRKNNAVLQAAAAQAAQQQLGGSAPAAPAGLSGRDEELLKLLLGNPTLRR